MSDLRDIAVKYAHLLSAPDYSKLLNLADEIERLRERLEIAGAHPFPKDFDALDLQGFRKVVTGYQVAVLAAVERNKALMAEIERLRAALKEIRDVARCSDLDHFL